MSKFSRSLNLFARPRYCRAGPAAICAILFALAAHSAYGHALSPAWVELGDGGKAIARIVVTDPGDCPPIQIDGESRPMSLRKPEPAGLRPVCEFAISSSAKSASVNNQALALPRPNPTRVIAIGDTGCRIKGTRAQDCNDPAVWPFREIASAARSENPDLIIHVGDYLYRESPCREGSDAMCGGTAVGDNWEAWNADFFTPAAKLLAAVPWVFTRGNHESCDRSWRGWFYYLDPRPWDGTCKEYSPPYVVKLGTFEIAMLDASAVKEDDFDESQVAEYAEQLASFHAENAWLLVHYPFWGFKTDPHGGPPVALVASLQAAWVKAAPKGFTMILSGHIHLFEFVSVDHGRPPQILVGDGGTEMAVPIQISLNGTQIRGASVVSSKNQHQFGYSLFTRMGADWKRELKNSLKQVLVNCPISAGSAACEGAGSD